ncbi:hypothetical protein AN4091.2 [Aspergillus nidulans FGSC A4]|uniref:Uncharacterized protein n=1 Tax=Emericella nidulans (strain FGSC A4 / ATCC 38163 / CBS 112.46 / NRRL 194 / M139) TaxID=227321 RepID=Q5B5T9_EMENI|nr:hypothetical protein [Aspergillus nidulans FGSC A4]EAA59352.1 hypothetical protein AN4091.2 [Aspergillus nidulans FGSC A4]CBF74724.1 TPA: conserved hypothetical protein [Aspergillus nidulans FGSC A4]|eukprot:XP_661695.1 hypothetical protein AN4091.2 [Aspergillus nidulans FGSC A4]
MQGIVALAVSLTLGAMPCLTSLKTKRSFPPAPLSTATGMRTERLQRTLRIYRLPDSPSQHRHLAIHANQTGFSVGDDCVVYASDGSGTMIQSLQVPKLILDSQNSQEDKMQRVQAAAKLAFAHDFIQNLPQGYLTRIGERGSLLSGGQKQRIAVARSMISEPKVLLLDEATSALDPHAEGIVQQALDSASANRTTVIIAHKLATMRNADKIVVMSEGKIAKQGQHEELAQQLAALKDQEDYKLYGETGIIHNIWKLLTGTPGLWLWFVVTTATYIAGAAVNPRQILLLGNILSVFDSPNFIARGNFIVLMFFVMSIGILVIYFVVGWSTNTIAQTLSRKLRRVIFLSFLRQDLQFFDQPENTVGALISRLDSYPQAILELMGFTVAIILMSAINIVASSVLVIAVSWKLGLVGVFAGLPPMMVGGLARARIEAKMDEEVGQRMSASASVASETALAIRTMSSLVLENTALKIWGSKLINDGEISLYQFIVSFMVVYFSGQATALAFSSPAVSLAKRDLVYRDHWQVLSPGFTKANQAANYYFWLDMIDGTVRGTDDNRNEGPKDGCRSIDFEDIRRGAFIALVGALGCGKSTMIFASRALLRPDKRLHRYKHVNAAANPKPAYRRQLSLVQQEPTLFLGTIRENILQGIPDFGLNASRTETGSNSDWAIEEACRAANVWDFMSSLPEGLDTPCGSGTSIQLSGGQRQRIAIARALIRKPNVLLLDEATSALDTESEKLVQGALTEAAAEQNRITVAVAHWLSTVRDADCIFVFHAGRIVEFGSHSELLSRGGMYAAMCEARSWM